MPRQRRSKIHKRYKCPRCESNNTRYKGLSPSKVSPKPRYKCEDCEKTWTLKSEGRGGDRRSQEFQERKPKQIKVPKREGHFAPSRKIDGHLVTLQRVFQDKENPAKAWESAKDYREEIAAETLKARVAIAYDSKGRHLGAYAVYAKTETDKN